MAEVDTSSYPKFGNQKSALEIASQLGQLQQQHLNVERSKVALEADKLNLVNQHYDNMTKDLISLGPNPTRQDLINTAQNQVKYKRITPEMFSTFVSSMPTDDKELPEFANRTIAKVMSTQEALNFGWGQMGAIKNGQTEQPTLSSPRTGFGVRSSQAPIQTNLPPPTTQTYNSKGQPQLLGEQPAVAAPGAVIAPPPMNGPLPVGPISGAIQGQSANFSGNVLGGSVEPPTRPGVPIPQPRPAMPGSDEPIKPRMVQTQAMPPLVPPVPKDNSPPKPGEPRGPVTGPSPLFNEGLKAYTEDRNHAMQLQTNLRPLLNALPYLKGLQTGPGTEQFNRAVAALKSFGILPTDIKDDKTAIYQKVQKYLAQYVQGNPVGQRSDAAQHLSEKATASVGNQINPALVDLVHNAIIQDRVKAALPDTFGHNGNYDDYIRHRSIVPPKLDERAFGLDIMESEDKNALLKKMREKIQKDPHDFEARKFLQSLAIADSSGLYPNSDTGR